MRTYSGLLLFENLFDFIPQDNPDMVNLARTILGPNLLVVEDNCNTMLGKFIDLNFESEGLIDLSTGLPLTRASIEHSLSLGIYKININHTSTCISKNGVCAKCYSSTFPDKPIPKVNDRVNIDPEYIVDSEIIVSRTGVYQYSLGLSYNAYDKVYVYRNGLLLVPGIDYNLDTTNINITENLENESRILIRYISYNTFPFIVWLSQTFSGSLFGMKSLHSYTLPIRSLLLSSLLTENRLQLLSESLTQIDSIPENYLNYTDTIKDPLEKGLYILALYCIYSNVLNT